MVINAETGENTWFINNRDAEVSGVNFTPYVNYFPTNQLQNSAYFFADLDGDGRMDFLTFRRTWNPSNNIRNAYEIYMNQSSSELLFIESNRSYGLSSSRLYDSSQGTSSARPLNYLVFADFDADGKDDLLIYRYNPFNGNNRWYQNTFNENGNIFVQKHNNLFDTRFFSGRDYTRSCKIELQDGQTYQCNDFNPVFDTIPSLIMPDARHPIFTDLNGDGLVDIVFRPHHLWATHLYGQGSNWIATGEGFQQQHMLFTAINKGDFDFENPRRRSSGGANDWNAPCLLGRFVWWDSKVDSSQSWLRYPVFADITSSGKADMIVFNSGDNLSDQNNNWGILKTNVRFEEGMYCENYQLSYLTLGDYEMNHNFEMILGRFNGLGTDFLFFNEDNGNTVLLKNNVGTQPPVVTEIKGGFRGDYYIDYKPMNDPDVYVKGNHRSYPEIDYSSQLPVVHSYRFQHGTLPPVIHYEYKYYEGRLELQGRGFRGFTKIEQRDLVDGFFTVSEFEEDFRLVGSPLKYRAVYSPSGVLISEEEYWNVQLEFSADGEEDVYIPWIIAEEQKVFTPYPYQSVVRSFELDGELISEITTRNVIDKFGNLNYQVIDYGDGCRDSLVNQYFNNFDSWIIGRLTHSRLFRSCEGQQTVIRESSFEYDPVYGQLTKEISEPFAPSDLLRYEKSYEYDLFGNIKVSRERAWNGERVEERFHLTEYDNTGRFIVETRNTLGHRSFIEVDDYTGNPLVHTDENGLTTLYEYGDFGKLTKITFPDGNYEEYSITTGEYFHPWNINGEEMPMMVTNSSVNSETVDFASHYGFLQSSNNVGFDGHQIVRRYNSFSGQLYGISQPGTELESIPDRSFSYDELNRLITTTVSKLHWPWIPAFYEEKYYTYEYNGRSTTHINPLGQQHTYTSDFQNRLISSIDQQGNEVSFQYDVQGNLTTIAADGNDYIIEREYDLLGRMIRQKDPSLGEEHYEYDRFGNMISYTNGNGIKVNYQYDAINRLTQISRPEGDITFTYDEGDHALGLLSAIDAPDYNKTLVYDELSRISEKILIISGEEYRYVYHYNDLGKIDRVEHPSGINLQYHYNEYNYFYKITNYNTGELYYEILEKDAKGRILKERSGNGVKNSYVYDIVYIEDINGFDEPFVYHFNDNPIRITSEKVVGDQRNVLVDLIYEYDDLDQVISKTDSISLLREIYHYDDLNRMTKVGYIDLSDPIITLDSIFDEWGYFLYMGEVYKYNDSLLMEYDKWGNIVYKSDVGHYRYESNDNPILLTGIDLLDEDCIVPSSLFNYEYTSFNKVSRIFGMDSELIINYGPFDQRIKQHYFKEGELFMTKKHISPDYEIIEINGELIKRIYIDDEFGHVASIDILKSGEQTTEYYHKDFLGSVIAVSDSEGDLKYRFQYDPWGQREMSFGADSNAENTLRGFTGHEHISIFDLVNMNGRIYDPVLGRFLSPDPFIQDPTLFQNFNRYSYILNKPTSGVDPSGYILKKVGNKVSNFFSSANNIINSVNNSLRDIANGNIRSGLKGLGQSGIDVWYRGSGLREIDHRGAKVFGEKNWNKMVVTAAVITVSVVTKGAGTGFATSIKAGAAGGLTGGALSAGRGGAGTSDIIKNALQGAAFGAAAGGATHGLGIHTAGIEDKFTQNTINVLGSGVIQGTLSDINGGKFSHGFFAGAISGAAKVSTKDMSLGYQIAGSAVAGGINSSILGYDFLSGALTESFKSMYVASIKGEFSTNNFDRSNQSTLHGSDRLSGNFSADPNIANNTTMKIPQMLDSRPMEPIKIKINTMQIISKDKKKPYKNLLIAF